MKVKLSHILFAGAVALCLGLPTQAATTTFATSLSGPNESPPNGSAGTGWSQAVYDDVAHTLYITISFAGLGAATTAAHIHAAAMLSPQQTAGVAIDTPYLDGFPLGVFSSFFDVFVDLGDLNNYNPMFVTANGGTAATAEAAFITYMKTDRAYVNIHTTQYPAGEIRGFYKEVPDTATTVGLFGFALGVLGLVARRLRVAA